jgi:hypothetical protein
LSTVISFGLQVSVEFDILPGELFVGWVVIAQAALAALIQAGVATVIAVRVKRLGTLHGLFAALVAGCVMMVGALIIFVVFSGRPLGYYFQSFPYGTTLQLSASVINGGTCLALPMVLGISMVAGWLRQHKVHSSSGAVKI